MNISNTRIHRRLFLQSSAAVAGLWCYFGNARALRADTKVLRAVSGESDGPTGTMDPAHNKIDADSARVSMVYERMVILDDTFTPRPQLAESWENDETGDVWTFRLKQGINFHNGAEMTANDVVYSFRRLIDPDVGSAAAQTFSAMTSEGIQALDKYTVQFSLQSPVVEFPSLIANRFTYIVPEGATSEALRTRGVGTGPFKVEDFTPGNEPSVFVKNDNYWRPGLPKVDRIELRSIPNAASRISALLTGQVDLSWDVPRVGIQSLEDSEDITVSSVRSPYVMSLTMWVDTPPFDDVRVREAMKLVVDRQQMIDLALGGRGQLADDHPVASWVQYSIGGTPRERDIATAKRLLAEAGHPNGLDVELHTSEAIPGFLEMATLYQAMAAEAGITVAITKAPADGYWANVWRKVPFMCTAKSGRNADEAMALFYLSDADWNDTRWKSEEFDGHIRQARQTVDPAQREELYQNAQRLIRDDGGSILPMFADSVGAQRRDLTGWKLHPQKFNMDFSEVAFTS